MLFHFFFFKQKTAYEMRISDWSSDVCSSDLPPGGNGLYVITADPHAVWARCQAAGVEVIRPPEEPHYDPGGMGFSVRDPEGNEIGRASCRERVCQYV